MVSQDLIQLKREEARNRPLARKLKRLEFKIQEEEGKIETVGSKDQDRALEVWIFGVNPAVYDS